MIGVYVAADFGLTGKASQDGTTGGETSNLLTLAPGVNFAS